MNNENYDGYPVKTYGKVTTRDYQQAAIDAAIEHCKTSHDPAILDISVGGGKTIIIGALSKHVSDRNGKVMMLSRQSIICEQNATDAWLCECKNSLYSAGLGIKSAAYGVIYGSEGTVLKSLEADAAFLNGDRKTPSKLKDYYCDLILIDECHHYDWMNEDSQYSKIIKEMYRRNPKMKVIGLTGTSYRSTTPIVGLADDYFWKKRLINISTTYLTDREFLVPITFGFGHDDVAYDLDEFKASGEDGLKDFTAEEMKAMEAKILSAETTTEKIIIEVVEKTKDRGGVMICVTGKKHMKEAARFLPEGSYAMISDDMPTKERNAELRAIYNGEKKFVLQINALSTGYNSPILDTLVILRKYHSLTLLTQTVGRVLRLLKPEQKAKGLVKDEALVLDYTDTFTEMGSLYENPILEEADLSKSKDNDKIITCPKCGTENGENAVRCRGLDHTGARCDFFWRSRICEPFFINGVLKNPGCGAENAPTARNCRCCENILIDHNAKLTNKSYTDADYKPVERFEMGPTRNGGVFINYHLPNGEVAKKYFNPFGTSKINKTIFYNQFIKHHAKGALAQQVRKARNAGELCQLSGMLDTVAAITHRINAKGDSVIAKFILKE